MSRLASILAKGLRTTARAWPDARRGYRWVHEAARILKNEAGLPGTEVGRGLAGLLDDIRRHRPTGGELAAAMGHFLKVTQSYWPGLFHGYDVPGLPTTNNDLERLFGSNRHHERRCTGRKATSPAMVLRGPARLIAATATRLRAPTPEALAPVEVAAWRKLRGELEERRESRKQRCRFRRDPAGYLRSLELDLLKPTLPP